MKKTNLVGFESAKAAQISAYFAAMEGRAISKLKLIKLIYLAERAFLQKFGDSMLYDEMFSFKDGPICSSTLNGLDEKLDVSVWNRYVKRLSSRGILSNMGLDRDQYDEISDAEWEILNLVWHEFGWMTASQIRNYTHRHCPEYTEVPSGRVPISFYDILKAVGDQNALERSEDIQSYRRSQALLEV